MDRRSAAVPRSLAWLFPEVELRALSAVRDGPFILARVLERGRLRDVRWAMDRFGLAGIHRFLREQGHPELSPRTLAFWRVVLDARKEAWKTPPAWRRSRIASWVE